jgi:polyferredoxin
VVQAFFFIFIALVAVSHALAETGVTIPLISSASLHALCPFGGVVSIYQFITAGTYVQKIHDSAFVLMGIGFLLAILFGPVFCGWVCPLGTIQELVGKLGTKLFTRRRYNHFIPEKIDRWLRYARYLVLAWVLYMTAVTGKLIFADVDPYFAMFNFWTSEVAIGGIIVLVITLAASLFVQRPWCKYACPYGAVLGIFNLFRVFSIQRSESLCKLDGACNKTCPMNINVSAVKTVRDHQCITCLECTSEAVCPVAGTVELRAGGLK